MESLFFPNRRRFRKVNEVGQSTSNEGAPEVPVTALTEDSCQRRSSNKITRTVTSITGIIMRQYYITIQISLNIFHTVWPQFFT